MHFTTRAGLQLLRSCFSNGNCLCSGNDITCMLFSQRRPNSRYRCQRADREYISVHEADDGNEFKRMTTLRTLVGYYHLHSLESGSMTAVILSLGDSRNCAGEGPKGERGHQLGQEWRTEMYGYRTASCNRSLTAISNIHPMGRGTLCRQPRLLLPCSADPPTRVNSQRP